MRVALNYKIIVKDLQRISKIMPFIDQYSWKETSSILHKKGWKKFASNNKTIVLNILFVAYNNEEIRHAYISKRNST